MANLLAQAINCDDPDRAARFIRDALGIESDDVVGYCFPTEWPADRERRARYIGRVAKDRGPLSRVVTPMGSKRLRVNMADENEHLAMLVAARSRMVTERREVASALTEKYKRAHTDDMRELLVQIQATIDAIDRAIADEKNMASAHAPPTVVGFIDRQKQ